MKLTNTRSLKAAAGMTLLELTVVILVLLSLITLLMFGTKKWKEGSDRAANIMNLRNVQQAVRGEQNMQNLKAGEGLSKVVIFGTNGDGVGGYLAEPKAPADGITYTYGTLVPDPGTLYTIVAYDSSKGASETKYGPKTGTTADW